MFFSWEEDVPGRVLFFVGMILVRVLSESFFYILQLKAIVEGREVPPRLPEGTGAIEDQESKNFQIHLTSVICSL